MEIVKKTVLLSALVAAIAVIPAEATDAMPVSQFTTVSSALISPTPAQKKDFQSVTEDNFDIFWEDGQNFTSNGNPESPELYGRQWRNSALNMISLVTPRTIVSYISFSHEKRLLQVDKEEFKKAIITNNNIVYLSTWARQASSGGVFGMGSVVAAQPLTQRLLIEKDGVWIYPQEMPPEIRKLMPYSHAVKFYGFPREVLLNTPYTVKWVTGHGDPLLVGIKDEKIDQMIDDELYFYNAKH